MGFLEPIVFLFDEKIRISEKIRLKLANDYYASELMKLYCIPHFSKKLSFLILSPRNIPETLLLIDSVLSVSLIYHRKQSR